MTRRNYLNLLPLLIFILTAALVFAACGGDGEGAAAPTGDAGVTQPDSGSVAPTAMPDTTTTMTEPAPVEAMGEPVVKTADHIHRGPDH